METYSRRENLQFFGVPENTECTTEEGAQQGVAFENTREVMYKFLEEKLKIERRIVLLIIYKKTKTEE